MYVKFQLDQIIKSELKFEKNLEPKKLVIAKVLINNS